MQYTIIRKNDVDMDVIGKSISKNVNLKTTLIKCIHYAPKSFPLGMV